jgi:SnoaL-like polyketide cyclase
MNEFSEANIKKLCANMTAQQETNLRFWLDLQQTLNDGDFVKMDTFFHPDFTYGNPSRPDLGSYESWKTSPVELYKRFPPSRYVTLAAAASTDDRLWVHCHHHGYLTGGNYMGQEPKGQEINVEWFSTVDFKDGNIFRIFSIADVLGMLISVGAIDPSVMPVDPYK